MIHHAHEKNHACGSNQWKQYYMQLSAVTGLILIGLTPHYQDVDTAGVVFLECAPWTIYIGTARDPALI